LKALIVFTWDAELCGLFKGERIRKTTRQLGNRNAEFKSDPCILRFSEKTRLRIYEGNRISAQDV
jgi:hypothetical protein